MPNITLPNNWEPRFYQMSLWEQLEMGQRRIFALWHRRAGKDDVCLHWTATAAHERVGNYWHMLPKAIQARRAIWQAVNPHTGKRRIDEAFPKELRDVTNDQEMFIRFKNGSTWNVVGSDNYDALVGSPPIGVVFSEFALADPSAWDFLRPILAENGGWALFITTPRGKNHAHKLYEFAKKDKHWFAQRLTVEDTRAIPEDVLEGELRELQATHGEDDGLAIYEQEYNCSFDAAIPGAYYAKLLVDAEKNGRIGDVPYDPNYPVTTAWDLGISDSTAIWFMQRMPSGRKNIIDYYEASGVGLDHYANVLQKKGYVYEEHRLPHDVKVSELGTGKSRLETLRTLGIGKVRVIKKHAVQDGINAGRILIPQCWFDEKKTEKGRNALGQYQREWNEKMQTYSQRPLHDWTSHAADGWRYLAWGERRVYDAGIKPRQAAGMDYDPLAME